MNIATLNRTKERVGYLLSQHEKARNSDSWLICKYWATFYPQKITRDEKGRAMIYLDEMVDVQSSESIRRTRQKIQNEEKMWMPTDPEVRKQRGISEEVYKEWATNTYE
jgi:hypothetical protein